MKRNHHIRMAIAVIFSLASTGLFSPLVAQKRLAAVRIPSKTLKEVATGFPFPARADDLKSGEYWYRGKKTHGTGIQKLGYDLGAVRFDGQAKTWAQYVKGVAPGTKRSDTKNSDWIIYGKRVYAMADGEVSGCWRNSPENPPGDLHPGRKSDPKTIPGGGNMLWVTQADGSRSLYAHFQPGTIPQALCPHNATFLTPGKSGETNIAEGSRPKVKQGQYLGKAGNAGNSTNPHLHIHRENDGKSASLPFHGAMVKGINNADAEPKWARLRNQPLPPGPIAILPNYKKGLEEISRHGLPSSGYQHAFQPHHGFGIPTGVD